MCASVCSRKREKEKETGRGRVCVRKREREIRSHNRDPREMPFRVLKARFGVCVLNDRPKSFTNNDNWKIFRHFLEVSKTDKSSHSSEKSRKWAFV